MTAPGHAVSIRDAWFAYGRGLPPAVAGVSLDVPPGEVVGIAGPNGSGKSTLARLVNGLLRPTTGTVIVDGLDTAAHPVRRLAAHVGYVFQSPSHQLFARTVAEELAFGPRNLGVPEAEVRRRVAELAARLRLEDVLSRHPYHLGAGPRKLVAIASVVAMAQPVVVLDEPTTGQDHRTAREVARLVRDLRDGGTTVLCIAHDATLLADLADRLVVLVGGRIIADDTPRHVFADGAVTAAARLVPPQVTRLSLRLAPGAAARPPGAWPALSIAELAATLGGPVRPGPSAATRAGATDDHPDDPAGPS